MTDKTALMLPKEVLTSKVFHIRGHNVMLDEDLAIRVFTRMREMLLNYKDLFIKLEQLERKLEGHDEEIKIVFVYLKKLLPPPEQIDRRRIGFRRSNEEE
jgi:hypothetical protein